MGSMVWGFLTPGILPEFLLQQTFKDCSYIFTDIYPIINNYLGFYLYNKYYPSYVSGIFSFSLSCSFSCTLYSSLKFRTTFLAYKGDISRHAKKNLICSQIQSAVGAIEAT